MSRITAFLVLLTSVSSLTAQDAKGVAPNAAVAIQPAVNCAAGSTNQDATRDCEKIDAARLFLIAGQTEAALRILCTTGPADAAFDKLDREKGCLRSVGLEPSVIKSER